MSSHRELLDALTSRLKDLRKNYTELLALETSSGLLIKKGEYADLEPLNLKKEALRKSSDEAMAAVRAAHENIKSRLSVKNAFLKDLPALMSLDGVEFLKSLESVRELGESLKKANAANVDLIDRSRRAANNDLQNIKAGKKIIDKYKLRKEQAARYIDKLK